MYMYSHDEKIICIIISNQYTYAVADIVDRVQSVEGIFYGKY